LVGEVPRIGLYCDLRNPGASRPWPDVYRRTLDRVVEAERRGLPAVWATEHHGFADGYLPQPLTFAAAVAGRTSRIRIGTAIVIAPLVHPRALAEQAAIVDLLSDGRLELGLGAGYREDEFAGFDADRSRRFETLEAVAARLPELWSSGAVTPPPAQRPLPIWIGGRGPRCARIAGRLGAGLLWLDRKLWTIYRDTLAASGHDTSSARVGGLVNVFLADDPEAALAEIREQGRHNRRSYDSGDARRNRNGTDGGRSGRGDDRRERGVTGDARRDRGRSQSGGSGPLLRLEVLSPAGAAEKIAKEIEGMPVTDVFCFERIGALEGELVDRHVELLCDALPAALAARLAAASS
jgi:alkanesulfonate monooxygenase SsuD/methylene tetrahydromethanopterin reductase-like flavin-dependent oxidoreductase (luciferase family)